MTKILIWVLLWTLVSFALMGIDKWKAIHHRRRIPEKVLFFTAALGGSVGAMLGMTLFHHKTDARAHPGFVWGVPAMFLLELAACQYFFL